MGDLYTLFNMLGTIEMIYMYMTTPNPRILCLNLVATPLNVVDMLSEVLHDYKREREREREMMV